MIPEPPAKPPIVAPSTVNLPPRHTLTGIFRRHAEFASTKLKSARTVLVWLPPDYFDHPEKRYPTLYLQDGQNLFDGATSFIGGQEWRVDEAADRLIRTGQMEPTIIVGIYNAGADRLAEYTPTRDNRGRGGSGDDYVFFLTDELKPFIDRMYRTRPGPSDTGVGGSSLGGLISLYTALKRPDVFGRVAVLSPSVWWDDRAIVKQVKALKQKPALRIWVDIGTGEGFSAPPDARQLRDALIARGWSLNHDLDYTEAEGAQHNEAAWAARIGDVLHFLYPPH